MRGRGTCNKCVLTSVLVCSSVFAVGVALLVVGFIRFNSKPPPPPYIWSMALCPGLKVDNNINTWLGYDLAGETCPINPSKGEKQSFKVPSHILGESIPYEPVFYITDKVIGEIIISHTVGGEIIYSEGGDLSSLDTVPYALCGGKMMNVYRMGPLIPTEGDYINLNCQSSETGCKYEPGRSLNSYSFGTKYVHMESVPSSGSTIVVEVTLYANSTSSVTTPDVFVEYRIAGRGPVQDSGLVLLIIGGLMADLMPATLFFLLQRYYYIQRTPANEELSGMIPLMEMN